jgi:RNA polymerase sigma-70 factor (ECF subfamily)
MARLGGEQPGIFIRFRVILSSLRLSTLGSDLSRQVPIMDDKTRQAARAWTLAQPVVSAFVHSLVHDFGDRDDVLQEVAVAVIESFDRYDAARPFVGWALGVARNQVGLYLRRRGRDRLVFDAAAVDQLAVAFESVTNDELHALDHLRSCMQQLEARARRLCELRYGRDLKPAAIADIVETSANAVAKALQRVREQLRECIERKTSAGLAQ